jgi:hypothetical protein
MPCLYSLRRTMQNQLMTLQCLDPAFCPDAVAVYLDLLACSVRRLEASLVLQNATWHVFESMPGNALLARYTQVCARAADLEDFARWLSDQARALRTSPAARAIQPRLLACVDLLSRRAFAELRRWLSLQDSLQLYALLVNHPVDQWGQD